MRRASRSSKMVLTFLQKRRSAWRATPAGWSCDTTRTAASPRSARGHGRFHRRWGARFSIATKAVAFRAADCRLDRATTSGTGHMVARRSCRISQCCVAGITGRSTKRAFRSSDSLTVSCASGGRTGGYCPTCRRLQCRRIRATRYKHRTAERRCRSTREPRCPAGRESASTSVMRSASYTRAQSRVDHERSTSRAAADARRAPRPHRASRTSRARRTPTRRRSAPAAPTRPAG